MAVSPIPTSTGQPIALGERLRMHKVVFVEEPISPALHVQPSRGERGCIFTYIPRYRVIDMVVAPIAQSAELKVCLEWGSASDERRLLLQPQIAAQWQRAWLDA